MRRGFWLAGLACLQVSIASADDGETIEVTDVSPSQALRESPYTVTVVDVQKYENRALDLDEVLSREAGVRVRVAGGVGGSSTVSLRGLEGRRVGIFIDGRPIDTPDGSFGINDLPLQVIERIEIYKGIVPARFGSDNLGGAINVITKRVMHSYFDGGVSVASYGVERAFALAKYRDPVAGYAVEFGLNGVYATNDFEMPGPTGAPVRRDHDGFKDLLGGGSIELTKGIWFDRAELEVGFIGSRKQLQGLPETGTVAESDFQQANVTNWALATLLTLDRTSDAFDLLYTLGVPMFQTKFRDLATVITDFDGAQRPNPNGRGEVGFGPNDSRDRRLDVRQRLLLTYHLDKDQDLVGSNFSVLSAFRPRDEVADAAAGFHVTPRDGDAISSVSGVTYEGKLLDHRLFVAGGLRHYFFHARGTQTNIYDLVINQETAPTEQSRNAFGANLAARYRVSGDLMVKLGVDRSVRLPSTGELFGNGITIQGSAALRPEVSSTINAGAYFEHAGWRAELAGFASRATDYITLQGLNTPVYSNIGEVRRLGVELDTRARPARWLELYLNGTYIDARNTADFQFDSMQPNFLKGLRIPNLPYLFGNAGATARFGHTTVFYDASAVYEYFADYEVSLAQDRKIPSSVTHAVGVQQSFDHDRYSIDLEGDDLTSARRLDDYGRPLPGRTFRLFFRMTFL